MAHRVSKPSKRKRARRYCVVSRNFDTFVCDLSLKEAQAMKASIPSAKIVAPGRKR